MKKIKKNIYIIFAIAFLIISIGVSGVIVALNFNIEAASQTAIGHIYIGDATSEERKQIVEDAFETWKKDTENSGGYTFKYQNKTYQFNPSDHLKLNLDTTLSQIVSGSKDNKLYLMPIDGEALGKVESDIEKALGVQNVNWGDRLNATKTEGFWGELYSKIGGLYTTAEIDMYNYVSTLSSNESYKNIEFSAKNSISARVELDVTGYEDDATAIVNSLPTQKHITTNVSKEEKTNEYKGIKVLADQATGFSLLNYVEENKIGLNSQQLSILGTGLTAIAMNSNFTNVRRVNDTANATSKYAYYGVENYKVYDSKGLEVTGATNSYGVASKISVKNNQDLSFYNKDTYDYNILVDYDEASKKLVFILVGPKSVYDYTLSANINEIDPTKSYKNMTDDFVLPENDSEVESFKLYLAALGYVDVTTDGDFLEENSALKSLFNSEAQYCYALVNSGKKGANIQYYKNYVSSGTNVQDKAFRIVTYEASIEEVQYVVFSKTYTTSMF